MKKPSMTVRTIPTPSSLAKSPTTQNPNVTIFIDYLVNEMKRPSGERSGGEGYFLYSVRRPFYADMREEMDRILAYFGWVIVEVQVYEETQSGCPYITLKPLGRD